MQKNDIARQAYMVTVLCVGPDKSGQVRTGVISYFSSTVSRMLSKFAHPKTCVQFSNHSSLETLLPSELVETAVRHASIGIRWELV